MLPSKFVVKTDKKLPIQDGRGLFEGNLPVKANCMHQSRFSSAASHIGYSKLCQSLVFRTKFGLWQKTKQRMALDRQGESLSCEDGR